MELDFIKRVRPFMKIRKAPTSLDEDRIEGSVVHFAKDIHEVLTYTSNLNLNSLMIDTILITEHLDNVKTHCNFTPSYTYKYCTGVVVLEQQILL